MWSLRRPTRQGYDKVRQATGKASLTPVQRTKGGKVYWIARGQVPVRNEDGTVGSRRVERGFGPDCTTEKQRLTKCAEWNREYEDQFLNPRKFLTFARAYMNYISMGHPVPVHATTIVEELGHLQCVDIDDSHILDAAEEIWPEGANASTLNRHLLTPVIAILRMALRERAPELTRPKGHNEVLPVIIPPESWYRELARELNSSQFAFVMFLAMHGRRTGEALSRRPGDLDPTTGVLDLGRTKTGVRQIELQRGALKLILAMPGWQRREWLFGVGPTSANSMRRDIKAACDRAGLPWYHPHSFGRHASVTRMLRAGYSVAHVADAHGMTPEMVTRRYGHLTRRETTEAMHRVGGAFLDKILMGETRGKPELGSPRVDMDISLLQKGNSSLIARTSLLPSEGSTLSS
jgi:integrase